MNPETPAPENPMLARLVAVIDELKAIRARRWLEQYPPGHPERHGPVPDFVRDYERKEATR